MIIKQVRLSNHAKEQLIRLKTRTGIQNWNVLCRWALREPTPPSPIVVPADSNVELSWKFEAGSMKYRCASRDRDSAQSSQFVCFALFESN